MTLPVKTVASGTEPSPAPYAEAEAVQEDTKDLLAIKIGHINSTGNEPLDRLNIAGVVLSIESGMAYEAKDGAFRLKDKDIRVVLDEECSIEAQNGTIDFSKDGIVSVSLSGNVNCKTSDSEFVADRAHYFQDEGKDCHQIELAGGANWQLEGNQFSADKIVMVLDDESVVLTGHAKFTRQSKRSDPVRMTAECIQWDMDTNELNASMKPDFEGAISRILHEPETFRKAIGEALKPGK